MNLCNNELILNLNNPLTDEQWDAITDVDFDNTNEIEFCTKHGKKVKFKKFETAEWVYDPDGMDWGIPAWKCSKCYGINHNIPTHVNAKRVMNPNTWAGSRYCPNCGRTMKKS